MRTFTVILSFGIAVMLLGCGLLIGGDKSPESEPVTPSAEPTEVSEGAQPVEVTPSEVVGWDAVRGLAAVNLFRPQFARGEDPCVSRRSPGCGSTPQPRR